MIRRRTFLGLLAGLLPLAIVSCKRRKTADDFEREVKLGPVRGQAYYIDRPIRLKGLYHVEGNTFYASGEAYIVISVSDAKRGSTFSDNMTYVDATTAEPSFELPYTHSRRAPITWKVH